MTAATWVRKEECLGQKKLHLNKKGDSILANNLLKYLRSNFWKNSTDSNCSRINDVECISELSEVNNLNRIVLAHLNFNSLRNKLDLLADQMKGNVDVLAISETKLHDSFPAGQIKIPGYASPFKLDWIKNGGGILVFLRDDIPIKFSSSEEKPLEAYFFELNFHKKKWVMCCSYNPNKSNNSRHLDTLRNSLDLYWAHYENTILIGDFSASIDDPHMESFCKSYRFKSLIKDPTSFKNPENPSCIDLILTNSFIVFKILV